METEVQRPRDTYPITVKCVVSILSENIPDIVKIRNFAHSQNIIFTTREYNSIKFSDDCDHITRLPAFHIYVKNNYRNTFYLNTRPYQIIQDIVSEYEHAQLRKRLRRTWHTFYTELKEYIKITFKKKTAMENYQEEKDYQKNRRHSSIGEWA
jgi:hypothetical protein